MSNYSGWNANELISLLNGDIKAKRSCVLMPNWLCSVITWLGVNETLAGGCESNGGRDRRRDVYIWSALLRQPACNHAVTHITQATCYPS